MTAEAKQEIVRAFAQLDSVVNQLRMTVGEVQVFMQAYTVVKNVVEQHTVVDKVPVVPTPPGPRSVDC